MYHMMYLTQLVRSEYAVSLSGPRIASKRRMRHMFPNLPNLHKMWGSVMHEGQMTDTRHDLNTLLTSTIDSFHKGMTGATLANYVEFKDFLKDEKSGKIIGAIVYDKLAGKEHKVKAKVVVNCAGVHSDELRLKDDPKAEKRIVPSRGSHIILGKDILPDKTGIIIPQTVDGRLIYIINYNGYAMAGTTDVAHDTTHYLEPPQEDIDFIINELKLVFGDKKDYTILAKWCGLRPLII